MSKGWLVFMFLMMSLQAHAWDITINKTPFDGRVLGGPTDLFLEVDPLMKLVRLDLKAGDNGVTLGGESVPTRVLDGVTYVDAKKLAQMCGGRFVVSEARNSIDISLREAKADTAGAGPGGAGNNNYLAIESEAGDSIGEGKKYRMDFPKFSFIPDDAPRSVSMVITASDGQEWVLRFDAGAGKRLAPGIYEAIVSKGNRNPSMLVKHGGRSGPGWGTFEVLDFSAGRVPGHLAINFSLHAEGKPERKMLTGKVRYQTSVP